MRQEKSDVEAAAPTDALADACDHAVALAWEAGQVQKECGMDILPDEYARGALKFGLVEVRAPSRICCFGRSTGDTPAMHI